MSTAREDFRRLRRVPDDRVIAGVCAGLGRELGIDPVLLRVTLVLLTIFGGAGVVLYLAAWALIPKAEPDELVSGGVSGAASTAAAGLSTGTSRGTGPRSWSRVLVAALAVLAGLIMASWWGSWQTFSLLMLALIGLVALVRRQAGATRGAPANGDAWAGPGTGRSPAANGPGAVHGLPDTGGSISATTVNPASAGGGAATPSASDAGAGTTGPWAASRTHPSWPRRTEASGEDAVHTMPIPTGWTDHHPGARSSQGAGDQERSGRPLGGDEPSAEDQRATQPGWASWRRFEPAPAAFWDQPDPLHLRDPWPDPLGPHDDRADHERTGHERGTTKPVRTGTSALPANAAATGAPATRPKRRGRFLLPLFTLLGVLVVTGLVGASGEPPASAYIAASLGVIGVGVLAGTWLGRSITLIVCGVLTLVALLPTTVVDLAQPRLNDAESGSLRPFPASIEEIDPAYEVGAGDIRLDLTRVPFSDGDHARTALEMGTGQVTVVVPPNVDVDVTAEVGAGELILFDEQRGGFAHDRSALDLGRDGAGGGKLDLRIESGFGGVEVRRADR